MKKIPFWAGLFELHILTIKKCNEEVYTVAIRDLLNKLKYYQINRLGRFLEKTETENRQGKNGKKRKTGFWSINNTQT